jgi:hypothetical protein
MKIGREMPNPLKTLKTEKSGVFWVQEYQRQNTGFRWRNDLVSFSVRARFRRLKMTERAKRCTFAEKGA